MISLVSCLNEVLKCILAGDGSLQRYRTIPQVISSASGMHLELLSQEKGTGCLCRLLWIMWAGEQNSHRKARVWGKREIFLHHWFLKRMRYIAFFPFLSGQGNECGYIWLVANSTFLSDILRHLQCVILKFQFCRVQHFCDVWYETFEKSAQYWTPNLLYNPGVSRAYNVIYPRYQSLC